jgi:prefoldin subunit 5
MAPPLPSKGGDYLFSLNRDLKALNAAVMVITQKIKYLVRNEKILGRNLIVINKRVRDLQQQVSQTQNQGVNESVKAALDDLTRQVSAISQRLVELEAKVDDVSRSSAKSEDVREIKYVVDTLNPLHFITIEQAQQMMDKDKK